MDISQSLHFTTRILKFFTFKIDHLISIIYHTFVDITKGGQKEVKNLKEWAAVQELHKRKVPKLKIAKQLGISRNTVKKLIELKEEPKYTREHYATKVDPYMDLIRLWRTSQSLILMVLEYLES